MRLLPAAAIVGGFLLIYQAVVYGSDVNSVGHAFLSAGMFVAGTAVLLWVGMTLLFRTEQRR